jgi:hypothetical protein
MEFRMIGKDLMWLAAMLLLAGGANVGAREPATKTFGVSVAGETLKLPILDRYCALDPANAAERTLLDTQVRQADSGHRKVLLMLADCAELAAFRAHKGARYGLIEYLAVLRTDGTPAKLPVGTAPETLLSAQAGAATSFDLKNVADDLAGNPNGGTPKPSRSGLLLQTDTANYLAELDHVAAGADAKSPIVSVASVGGMTVIAGVPIFATVSRFNPGPGAFEKLLEEDKALVVALQSANVDGN